MAGPSGAWTFLTPVSRSLGPWPWSLWGFCGPLLPPRAERAASATLGRGEGGSEARAACAPGPGWRLHVCVVVGGLGLLQEGGEDPLHLWGGRVEGSARTWADPLAGPPWPTRGPGAGSLSHLEEGDRGAVGHTEQEECDEDKEAVPHPVQLLTLGRPHAQVLEVQLCRHRPVSPPRPQARWWGGPASPP